MQFVSAELARLFEMSESMPQVHYVAHVKRLKPELNVAHEVIAGAQCVFIAPGSPIGRCVGLGLPDAVTASDLDRIEEFYRVRGVPAQIDVPPVVHATLLELLQSRPYRLEELNNVLVRPLGRHEKFDGVAEGVEIRAAVADDCDDLCEVVARGFSEGANPDPEFVELFRPLYQAEGVSAFTARVNGTVVGGAGVMIIPEGNIAAMFGSSTLPELRGRGIQTAFLQARLQVAVDHGCEYAVIVTRAGTVSQRNAERRGFTVAYTKAVMKRSFAE